ncbi:MAG: NADH-quinone oxidoreductase subunit NuoH [Anaerolineaceae bacterium]|nr:NADH-quinone oxidoreductase subunit NuoH [Anaerolineaceae bacterium]
MNFFSDPVNFIARWLESVLTGWGASAVLTQVILAVLGAGLLATVAMVFVTVLIWAERKIGGRVQDRPGPNRVGPWGIFQTIADMLKIFTKEYITPIGADLVPYNLAPVLSVAAVLSVWAVVPLSSTVFGTNVNVGILYIMAVGAIGELGVIFAGLGSNNKYAMLGGFRAVAQLVSYEVPMVVTLLIPVMFAGSMGINDIVKSQSVWNIFLAPVAALLFFITSIAENGRAPFDLIEADSELVAGFNIEYSGLKFGMFYVADFLHAFTSAMVFATIFLGGWRGPAAETLPVLGFLYLLLKTLAVYLLMLVLRFSIPRLRIDQMMNVNWKFLTPLSLINLVVMALAAKLVPAAPMLLRVGILVAINVVLWLITDRILTIADSKRDKERVIVSKPLPVARPEKVEPIEEGSAQA